MILSALPFSFDAGFSQLTTAFSVGAHVVLLTISACGCRAAARSASRNRAHRRPAALDPDRRQDWPTEASGHLRYFANTGGRMPKATLDRLRSLFPGAKPFLMYGRPRRSAPATSTRPKWTRRPGSIGKAIPNAEILVVRRTVPVRALARRASWCTAARLWPWGTGTP